MEDTTSSRAPRRLDGSPLHAYLLDIGRIVLVREGVAEGVVGVEQTLGAGSIVVEGSVRRGVGVARRRGSTRARGVFVRIRVVVVLARGLATVLLLPLVLARIVLAKVGERTG